MKKGTHAVQDQHQSRRGRASTDWKKLRARIAKAPQRPGIYRWLDAEGNILYIGKAKNLRKRLKTYLPKAGLPRTQAARPVSERSEWYRERVVRGPWKEALLEKIADIDWTLTANELEALMLETNLIKEHKPKFNVLMKDDKNYVYVKINVQEPYPRLEIVRRMEEENAKYFGPFVSGYDLRDTLDLLHTVFEWRACKRSLDSLNRASIRPSSLDFARDDRLGATQHDRALQECLEHQIGKCNGLCIGKVTQEEYRKRIFEVIRFFRGDRSEVIEHMKQMMQEVAAAKQFEKAAKFRNTLAHIQALEEQQIVSGTSGDNTDVFGVALLKDRSQVVLLKERDGKVVSELSFTLQGTAENAGDVLTQFLPQYYTSTQDIPDTILIKEPFEGQSSLEIWLSGKRQASSRKRIKIVVPARGKKSKLLRMAEENAAEKVEQQFAKWESEEAKVELALRGLQNVLALKDPPKRIECYDISHLGGTETVGSMVVFIDGKPRSDHYRSFTLRTIRKGEIDDYKALREVLTRRLRHLTNTEEKWKERGVVFGKARKDDQQTLEAIVQEHPNDLNDPDVDYRRYVVARKGNEIIACGTLREHKDNIRELTSIWVADPWRGQRLGHFIARKILRSVKRGKVYLMVHPRLEQYYAELGFRYIKSGPEILEKDLEAFLAHHPEEEGILMMYDTAQNKLDLSLTSTPDLLVLDGGKGQLGVGVEVLKRTNLAIPVISLAKEKEEVFAPGQEAGWSEAKPQDGQRAERLSLSIPEDARFLLMRLRDEAHRFANRHRERRAKHALVGS